MSERRATDAELRTWREELGLPVVSLASLTGFSQEAITDMEQGRAPVPSDLIDKLDKLSEITDSYVDRLEAESEEQGFIRTFRYHGELQTHIPEFYKFGAMWHRSCALRVQDAHPDLQIRYPERRMAISV